MSTTGGWTTVTKVYTTDNTNSTWNGDSYPEWGGISTSAPIITTTNNTVDLNNNWAMLLVNNKEIAMKLISRAIDKDWVPYINRRSLGVGTISIAFEPKKEFIRSLNPMPHVYGYNTIQSTYRDTPKTEYYWIPKEILVDPFALDESDDKELIKEIVLSLKQKWELA